LGYSLILILVATVRELLGSGKFLGIDVLPLVKMAAGMCRMALLLPPPSAFFLIGLIDLGRPRPGNRKQVEKADFAIMSTASRMGRAH
jgi:Na+-transporting NADH:ubiquinone oxidoreductase subunit D